MIKKSKVFFYMNLGLLIILVVKGFFLYQDLENKTSALASYYNKKIKFRAQVCAESEVSYKQQRLSLCLPHEKILIYAPLYPEYNYGDYLKVSGKLKKPEVFSDFNYPRYLAAQGIYATMYYPSLKVEKNDLSLRQELSLSVLKLKKKLKTTVDKSLPEPEASLANALILGYKKNMYIEDRDYFRKAGLSHLIVISGTHISILAALLFSGFIFLGLRRKGALRVLFLFFICYPLLIGFSAATIRASIMGALVFIAYYFGRLNNTKTGLVLAANIILVCNPLLLYSDIGFQLSFAALLGIIYIYPLFKAVSFRIARIKRAYRKPLLFFWEAFSLTLSCQLAIFPIIVFHFHSFASLSFIANPLIAWLISPLIASLSLALLFSLFIPSLAVVIFTPSYFMLHFFLSFAKQGALLEKFFIALPNFNEVHLSGYYLLLFLFIYVIKKRKKKKNSTKKGKRAGTEFAKN